MVVGEVTDLGRVDKGRTVHHRVPLDFCVEVSLLCPPMSASSTSVRVVNDPSSIHRSPRPRIPWQRLLRLQGRRAHPIGMAYYLVRAIPKTGLLGELQKQLKKSAFIGLCPFGKALTHSLNEARIQPDGVATWEEEDYCSPPLAQERAAVLDKYFDEISVERVDAGEGWKRIEALPRLNSNG